MTTEIEFAKAIEIIATDLGVAAEQIFAIFVSAQVMIGIIDIVSAIAMFGVAYLSWKYTRESCMGTFKNEDGNWDGDMLDKICAGVVVPLLVAAIAMVTTSLFTDLIGDALLKIACPEYTAMKEILNLVT